MNSKDNKNFTRRDFTKLAMAGAISAALPGSLWAQEQQQDPKQPEKPYPKNFRKIHDKMIVLDGCCPLLTWGIDPMSGRVDKATIGKGPALYIEGGVTAAGASVGGTRTSLELTRTSLKLHNQMIEDNGWIKVKSTADILRAKREKIFGMWYLFQGAYAVEDNLDLLEEFKEAGVGQVAPGYNYRNRFSSGQLDRSDAGLSMAGVDLIKKCNELGIIVDGVHNSDKDVFDMIEFSAAR